jgi:copper chaperone CopZ
MVFHIFPVESEGESMIKTTMKIDGMMCGMREAHICEAIRKAVPEAKKVTASKSKKQASFLTDKAVDNDFLKAAINATGYTCLGIASVPYEKKGLFGWR